MIIAPLVFTTLVVGIAKLGNVSAVGRGRSLRLVFYSLSYLLLLGMFFVNVLEPG
jgi:Na+/H+-dicarboxylate symporter